MSWFLIALRKYAVFSGRARRKEYWFFLLFYLILLFLPGTVLALLGVEAEDVLTAVILVTVLALALPNIAVTVRRLHDIGLSGWWILIGIIPLFGDIGLLVMTALPSQPAGNQYGSSPIEA